MLQSTFLQGCHIDPVGLPVLFKIHSAAIPPVCGLQWIVSGQICNISLDRVDGNIKFSGKLQNAFMYWFWAASTVWFIMELKNIDFGNYVSVFGGLPHEFTAFAKLIVMVWWCFAGFETCAGMGAEVKYPQITLPRALTISPFVVFAVNSLWQFFLVGLTPLGSQHILIASSSPLY